MDNDPLDPILRKPSVLAVLDVHNSTLNVWIKRGEFPPPRVLNPGQKREIVGWLTSVFLQWRVARPQRPAKADQCQLLHHRGPQQGRADPSREARRQGRGRRHGAGSRASRCAPGAETSLMNAMVPNMRAAWQRFQNWCRRRYPARRHVPLHGVLVQTRREE